MEQLAEQEALESFERIDKIDMTPTADIRANASEVRAGWDDYTEWKRRSGLKAERNQPREPIPWEFPTMKAPR